MALTAAEILTKTFCGKSPTSYKLGTPIAFENLAMVPLLLVKQGKNFYLTYSEAQEKDLVFALEKGRGGVVGEILLMNRSDVKVLVCEGEILKGAKQTRVVNTTILIPPNTENTIPVSCVEQHRWHYAEKRHFESVYFMMPTKLRSMKTASVTSNVPMGRFASDQEMIWEDIRERLAENDVLSQTCSIEDHFKANEDRIEIYIENFDFEKFKESERDLISGAILISGDKVMGLDAFDKNIVFRKMWAKILRSYVIDVISRRETKTEPEAAKELAKRFINMVCGMEMQVSNSPGLGEDVRFKNKDLTGAALIFEKEVIHAYAFPSFKSKLKKDRRENPDRFRLD